MPSSGKVGAEDDDDNDVDKGVKTKYVVQSLRYNSVLLCSEVRKRWW